MTYKAPKTIAAEEIKMTKFTLRHIFLYSELPSLGQILQQAFTKKGIAKHPGPKST
jgi:hypothetical protein